MNNKCILPWIHLEASATGHAKPCCLYKEPVIIDNKPAKLDNFSLEEIWNSDYMKNLRQQFLKGDKPHGCSACWEQEKVGKKSKRQESNEKYSHRIKRWQEALHPPTYLDLKLGTVCNLKCRSCSTHSSYKWKDDEIDLHGETFNKDLHSYWIDDDSPTWKEIENLIPYLEYLDFTGGEPFLIKKHFDLLEECVRQGCAENIEIHYNTNGTVMPKSKIFDVWKQFKNVDVMFSIDGIEEKFEYLRHPGKWADCVKTWETFLGYNFLTVSVCYSVSVFNVLYMNEFVDWFLKYDLPEHKIYFNIIFDPQYLNIQSFNKYQKDRITEFVSKRKNTSIDLKIQEVLDFMNSGYIDLPNKTEFFANTSKLDELRNESFSETFPELKEIIEYGHGRERFL